MYADRGSPGVAERLHRQLQKDLVAIGSSPVDQPLQSVRIGSKGQRHLSRKVLDRPFGQRPIETHAAQHDRYFWRGAGKRLLVDRPRKTSHGLRPSLAMRGKAP